MSATWVYCISVKQLKRNAYVVVIFTTLKRELQGSKMRLRIAVFALTLASFFILPGLATTSSNVKNLRSNGTIVYSLSVKRILFDDSQFSVDVCVSNADMIMNHFELAYRVPRMHSINPNLIALLYRNIRAVYDRAVEYGLFRNNSWILKDINGVQISSNVYHYWIVDVGNPNYQEWLANWVKNYINQYGYDGVFLDNCLPSIEIMWSTSPGPAINPRTGKAYTALEFEQAVIDVVNTIKNAIGNKLVIGNGVYEGQRFFGTNNPYYLDLLTKSAIDGIESEAWIMSLDTIEWYSESKWKASIDFAVWLENNFLNKPGKKMFLPVAQNSAPYERPGEALPNGTTKEQYVNYVFSSILLATRSSNNFLNFGYDLDSYTQNLFKKDVGAPVGSYYMINGTHVYSRDYTKVKVLVNPTNTTYRVDLNRNYTDSTGAMVSSLTLNPHVGMILGNPAS